MPKEFNQSLKQQALAGKFDDDTRAGILGVNSATTRLTPEQYFINRGSKLLQRWAGYIPPQGPKPEAADAFGNDFTVKNWVEYFRGLFKLPLELITERRLEKPLAKFMDQRNPVDRLQFFTELGPTLVSQLIKKKGKETNLDLSIFAQYLLQTIDELAVDYFGSLLPLSILVGSGKEFESTTQALVYQLAENVQASHALFDTDDVATLSPAELANYLPALQKACDNHELGMYLCFGLSLLLPLKPEQVQHLRELVADVQSTIKEIIQKFETDFGLTKDDLPAGMGDLGTNLGKDGHLASTTKILAIYDTYRGAMNQHQLVLLLDLQDKFLRQISLTYTDLTQVSFVGADLRQQDFSHSLLHNADFRGADLFKAKGEFTAEELLVPPPQPGSLGYMAQAILPGGGSRLPAEVKVNKDTILPNGRRPERSMITVQELFGR